MRNLFVISAICGALCACDDGGVVRDDPDAGLDAGIPDVDIPPDPPVFPLKAGDIVEMNVGARTQPCNAGEGFCDRAIDASYTIESVTLNEETNRWEIEAYFNYTLKKDGTSYASISRLFWSKVAPFGELMAVEATSDGTATFYTDVPLTDEHMTANGFPFFHFESNYANTEGSAFQTASAQFTSRLRTIDAEAEIENQAAAAKFEAYFKDDLGPDVYLHKVRVEFHRFGFACAVQEQLVDWQDGMPRSQASFNNTQPPVTNSFDNVFVRRAGTRYRCSCFSGVCQTVDGTNTCLDPTDPEAEASTEACEK